jgi:hypothetical protein
LLRALLTVSDMQRSVQLPTTADPTLRQIKFAAETKKGRRFPAALFLVSCFAQ